MSRVRGPGCGQLRHRVTIQEPIRAKDAGGGSTRTWTNVATVGAKIEPLKGMERLRAMQIEDSVTHKVTIRYRSGVKAAQRLLFGTRAFNIRAALNLEERNLWLELLCDEGVAT